MDYEEADMDDLERAQALRREAELLESKARVVSRLQQLSNISEDAFFSEYLAQLSQKLHNGELTPMEVLREAERSYALYRQRQTPVPLHQKKKRDLEFKLGANILSLVGAVFVLIGFIIFGFNYLSGIWQGCCLYLVALVLVLLSELLLGRKSRMFSNVITGIGIGGLYAANMANYLVMDTINGFVAMLLAAMISIGAMLVGRRKASAAIRIIGLLGCYLSFFPVRDFKTSLNFLVVALILLIVNVLSIFWNDQKQQIGVSVFHTCLNAVFTFIITGVAWFDGIDAIYIILYVVTSFVFVSILNLVSNRRGQKLLFPLFCTVNGLYLLELYVLGRVDFALNENVFEVLYIQGITKVLILAVSVVVFLWWNKEDGSRWNCLYYPAFIVLGLTSSYLGEVLATTLIVFFGVKFLGRYKEIRALDALVSAWTFARGLFLIPGNELLHGTGTITDGHVIEGVSCLLIIFMLAALLSALLVRADGLCLYHELMITGFVMAAMWELMGYLGLKTGWLCIAQAILLFSFLLIFNHSPKLREKSHFAYNLINVIFMALFYIAMCRESWQFKLPMLLLGTVVILTAFSERYALAMKKKYLLLAGFLIFYSVTGDHGAPVMESILLMVIALGCVGFGFRRRDKLERICGLTVAFFVCLKLALYDFREVELLYRMIVFMVVGVLMLGISLIYILLEKKEEK